VSCFKSALGGGLLLLVMLHIAVLNWQPSNGGEEELHVAEYKEEPPARQISDMAAPLNNLRLQSDPEELEEPTIQAQEYSSPKLRVSAQQHAPVTDPPSSPPTLRPTKKVEPPNHDDVDWMYMTKRERFDFLVMLGARFGAPSTQLPLEGFQRGIDLLFPKDWDTRDTFEEFDEADFDGSGYITWDEYRLSTFEDGPPQRKPSADEMPGDDDQHTPTPFPTRRPTRPTREPTTPTARPTRKPTFPLRPLREYEWSAAPSFPVKHEAVDELPRTESAPIAQRHHQKMDAIYWPQSRGPETAVQMATRLFWHTASVATHILDDGTSFVFTGDIDDLWLRDSAAQVHPYILMLGERQDMQLERLVAGLILRCAFYINFDPYANAFREDTSYHFSEEQKTQLGRYGYISTYDYELDSGCYFIRMLFFFCAVREEHKVCRSPVVIKAVETMVQVWEAEQHHEAGMNAKGWQPYVYLQLSRRGKGPKSAFTGMTWTASRPSDDVSSLSYLIPSNAFAVVVLGYAGQLARRWGHDGSLGASQSKRLSDRAARLAKSIEEGIQRFGIIEHPNFGQMYAYEVDGLGQQTLMDDANIPSLLSLPYLGYSVDPKVYANTRRFILSSNNPYFHCSEDRTVCGVGSPHTQRHIGNGVWLMSQLMQGLTSPRKDEKLDMLRQVMRSTGDQGWMHEAYDPDSSSHFTRPWFCWVDSLFAELVMSLAPGIVPSWAAEDWYQKAQRGCHKEGCKLDEATGSVKGLEAALAELQRPHAAR
jgi:meiotically up-regulated gene 157 (Mug157) protein